MTTSTATTATPSRKRASPPRSVQRSAKAAAKAVDSEATIVTLPIAGTLHLPSKRSLTYFAALGALAAFGVIEWPIAAVVGIGHLLAQQRGNAILEEFGEGLSDA